MQRTKHPSWLALHGLDALAVGLVIGAVGIIMYAVGSLPAWVLR